MKAIKIIGISSLFVVIILIIYYTIKGINDGGKTSSMKLKIKNSAKILGIPENIASKIANSDDSAKAAREIGVSNQVANVIANGRVQNFSKAEIFAMQGLPL